MIPNDRMDELRSALRADAASVAEALLGPSNKKLGKSKVMRWGGGGGLAVRVQGQDRGTWFDHRDPSLKGDMLRLIQQTLGCNFRGAVDWAARQTGVSINGNGDLDALSQEQRDQLEADRRARLAEQMAKDAAEAAADDARKVRVAQEIAAASVPIEGTLGERYIENTRGIPKPDQG